MDAALSQLGHTYEANNLKRLQLRVGLLYARSVRQTRAMQTIRPQACFASGDEKDLRGMANLGGLSLRNASTAQARSTSPLR